MPALGDGYLFLLVVDVAHNNVKFMFTDYKDKHFILIVQIFNNIFDCKVQKTMGLQVLPTYKPIAKRPKAFTALSEIHV